MGLEWVWGLLQPGFVRWAPPASQNHFNHCLLIQDNGQYMYLQTWTLADSLPPSATHHWANFSQPPLDLSTTWQRSEVHTVHHIHNTDTRCRRRKKTGAGDSLFARLNITQLLCLPLLSDSFNSKWTATVYSFVVYMYLIVSFDCIGFDDTLFIILYSAIQLFLLQACQ